MTQGGLLQLYDQQMRRDPAPSPGLDIARIGGVVRLTGPYNCFVYSDFSNADAEQEIAREMGHFRAINAPVEWKVHGHDAPGNLAELLRDRGFCPDPPETLLVREIDDDLLDIPVNPDVLVRAVKTDGDLDDFLSVTAEAFGQVFSDARAELMTRIRTGSASLHVAYLEGVAVAAGRLDTPPAKMFAGLYTGGVVAGHRSLGVYKALVRSRAREAALRGCRFLIVEALETSRPILARLGFEPLTTVQGWIFDPQ
jgi:hypothetical protein